MGEAGPRALNTLVSTDELARHPGWRVFDCRHDLVKHDLGEQQYLASHIPGAAFAHLDRDLSAPKTGSNGRHPLPRAGVFIDWLAAQGLKPSDQVVAYDGGSGAMASRLWWMLRWVGHDAVAVLDARAPARWRGEKEPIDPVAGRIPGSLNRFSNDNLTPEGVFKPAAQLRQEFESALGRRPPGEVVHSCGSGVAACHNLLAMEIAGLKGGKLYAGSWSEWIADPARPRERG